jgi:hypothetical protein
LKTTSSSFVERRLNALSLLLSHDSFKSLPLGQKLLTLKFKALIASELRENLMVEEIRQRLALLAKDDIISRFTEQRSMSLSKFYDHYTVGYSADNPTCVEISIIDIISESEHAKREEALTSIVRQKIDEQIFAGATEGVVILNSSEDPRSVTPYMSACFDKVDIQLEPYAIFSRCIIPLHLTVLINSLQNLGNFTVSVAFVLAADGRNVYSPFVLIAHVGYYHFVLGCFK